MSLKSLSGAVTICTVLTVGLLAPLAPVAAQQQQPQPQAQPQAQAQPQQQQGQRSTAILVVDVQRVIRDAKAATGVREQLQALGRSYEEEFNATTVTLREEQEELARQQTVLAADAFEERRQAFQQKVAEMQRSAQNRQRTLDEAYNKAMRDVTAVLNSVVAKVAGERSAALVLRRASALQVAPALDVTDAVLARLDQELPSVTIQVPESTPAQTTQ